MLRSDQFDYMIEFAKLCGDKVPENTRPEDKSLANDHGNIPGSLYNQRATWEEVLLPFGWKKLKERGGVTEWQRPGKDGKGISATTGFCHSAQGELLHVFSSNAAPFALGEDYSKFAAYAFLAHKGNFKAAASAIAEKYALPPKEPVPTLVVHESQEQPEEPEDDWPTAEQQPWPEPPSLDVYSGLIGAIVDQVLPQTSADPIAIAVQMLAMFGNVIGRSAYFPIEESRHYANIFCCLCGPTGRGRKGVSKGRALRAYEYLEADGDDWAQKRIQSGLQTGEGMIWAVRDPIWKTHLVKHKGRVIDTQMVQEDKGVDDKRLCILEDEFALVLASLLEKSSTLSARVRLAWDTGNINQMTKNNAVKTTGAHISIIGHVTVEELRKQLDDVQLANGFANRFLWVAVKQSKSLPLGGEPVELGILSHEMAEVVKFGKTVERMSFDAEAKEFWCQELYPRFERQLPGLLGAVTSRAAPQCLRLAIIFAVLDRKDAICLRHLVSAVALWDYCERSCAFIFGATLGDSIADEIRHALKSKGELGMTKTQVSELFGRHEKASAIDKALAKLLSANLARIEKVPKPKGGTPTTRIFSTEGAKSAKCANSAPQANDVKKVA